MWAARSRRRMPGLQSKEEIFSERLKEVSFAGSLEQPPKYERSRAAGGY